MKSLKILIISVVLLSACDGKKAYKTYKIKTVAGTTDTVRYNGPYCSERLEHGELTVVTSTRGDYMTIASSVLFFEEIEIVE